MFTPTAPPEIYTLSLHDALPIWHRGRGTGHVGEQRERPGTYPEVVAVAVGEEHRSEEHTSELQSQSNLVCRLPLEKKKTILTRPSNFNPRRTRRTLFTQGWPLPM